MRSMNQVTIDEMVKAYPQSVRLTEVKIRDRGEVKKLDAGELVLRTGDRVLLEVDGEAFIPPMRVLKPILRKANGEDAALVSRLERLSHEAMAYCRAKASEMKLRLKLVEVYGALQRRQLTFVYTADDRIDFRELVRDLARRFGGRIEMRQVGVREEARRLGGLDTCGLVLCCTSFLTEVKPVTVKQARTMGLQVEDPRLLGVCGRLKCCLMFEMMDAQGAVSQPAQKLITPSRSTPPVRSS